MAKSDGSGGRRGGGGDSRTPAQRAMQDYGGRLWEKGGKSRVYLGKREVLDEVGLNVTYRPRQGTIERATIGGGYISNSQAGAIVYNAGSVYLDNATGELVSPRITNTTYRSGIERIASRIGARGVKYD